MGYWWGWMESNHLPSGYEPPALTGELHPLVSVCWRPTFVRKLTNFRSFATLHLNFAYSSFAPWFAKLVQSKNIQIISDDWVYFAGYNMNIRMKNKYVR